MRLKKMRWSSCQVNTWMTETKGIMRFLVKVSIKLRVVLIICEMLLSPRMILLWKKKKKKKKKIFLLLFSNSNKYFFFFLVEVKIN